MAAQKLNKRAPDNLTIMKIFHVSPENVSLYFYLVGETFTLALLNIFDYKARVPKQSRKLSKTFSIWLL